MANLREKVFSLALGAILLSTLSVNVVADNNTEQGQTLEEYLAFCIPEYITAQQIETDGTVQYSAPIDLYNFENNSVVGCEVFVIENNELIGKLNVYSSEDGYTSSFNTGITDDIAASYSDGEEIAFGFYEDSVWLYTVNDGFVFVDGLYKGAPETVPTQLSEITTLGSVQLPISGVSRAIGGILLDVEHVHNSRTHDSNGQCSEASVAMVLNYHRGISIDADDVWEAINNEAISEHPYLALQFFRYNTIYANTALSANSAYQALVADKPIIASLRTSDGENGHAVVICGVAIDATYSTYTIDDPNYRTKKSFIINANPNTVNNSLSYTSAGYNFVRWYRYAY